MQWLLLSLGHTVSLCWDKTPVQVLQICKLGKVSKLKLIKCSGQKIPRNESGFVRTIPSLVLILKQPGYFSQALDTLRFQYQLVSPGLAVTELDPDSRSAVYSSPTVDTKPLWTSTSYLQNEGSDWTRLSLQLLLTPSVSFSYFVAAVQGDTWSCRSCTLPFYSDSLLTMSSRVPNFPGFPWCPYSFSVSFTLSFPFLTP